MVLLLKLLLVGRVQEVKMISEKGNGSEIISREEFEALFEKKGVDEASEEA